MSTIEGNRIIALFDGWTIEPGMENEPDPYFNRGWNMVILSNMRYHESWDWLMPVVEKIESMERGAMVNICMSYVSITEEEMPPIAVRNPRPKIQNAWDAVIQFIQWYNQQTPQP